MKRVEIRDLPDSIASALTAGEPILVSEGKKGVGLLMPISDKAKFPLEIRRELFLEFSAQIGAALDALGISEAEIERDFSEFRRRQRRKRDSESTSSGSG